MKSVILAFGLAFAFTCSGIVLAQNRPGAATREVEPFKGITTHGKVEQGLFKIRATGVSTAPIREAAEASIRTGLRR